MSELKLSEDDQFLIGAKQLLRPLKQVNNISEEYQRMQAELLNDIQIRIGTLLKTETVSFLLGAGASVGCGGPLLGSIPIEMEKLLLQRGILGSARPRVRRWLSVFYTAVRNVLNGDNVPLKNDEIKTRRQQLISPPPTGIDKLKANFEHVLAQLHRWRAALPSNGGRLRIEGSLPVDVEARHLDEAIKEATVALAEACHLPVSGKEDTLTTHKSFLRKLLTRPLNLKRVNIFTLNYDTLIEQAADAEGIVLLDGFVGTQRRVFRPEVYEQDLYFPAETTEGRVHRFDRVLHLYKLHGSITWKASKPTLENPYGIESARFESNFSDLLLIYPTPAKYGETLGMPYSELFRRFASAVVRSQSVLFVIGYGFGDEHVNAIIRQALVIPSFTLVIVDPNPKSDFYKALSEQKDPRIWVSKGTTLGTFLGFVQHVLPDLHEESIQMKVLKTHEALGNTPQAQRGVTDG